MSKDVVYIGLGSLNVKIRLPKMAVIVGRSFSLRLQGTAEEGQIGVRRKMSSV